MQMTLSSSSRSTHSTLTQAFRTFEMLFNKIQESIIREAIIEHLDKYQLISSTQHGFRRGGSCLSDLIRSLDKVSGFLDADECIDVIYLDFSKAFDKGWVTLTANFK